STDSWSMLMNVFKEANSTFEDSNATQEKVDEISIALENAIEQLELIIFPQKLAILLDLAQLTLDKADIYTGDEGYEGQVTQSAYDSLKDIVKASKEAYLEILPNIDEENMTEYDKGRLAEIMIPLNQAIDDFNGSIVHI
ncbi:hypothetical protein, partial [Clostridium perfringens]|uniref:hypothetical protein n=1 Tax=Clostridium perfringens TaxID=1502 RepID=UPI002ACBECC4